MCADLAELAIEKTERMRERLPTLREFGIAAEPFPGYVNPELDLHGLDVVLLTFVLRGEGRHVIGDIEYAVTSPSVGITRTGERHALLTGDAGLDVVNVYLDAEVHPLPLLAPPLDIALAALIPFSATVVDRHARLAQVGLDNIDEIEPILTLLVRESASTSAGTGDALDALRKLLLTLCARAIFDHGLVPGRRALGASESAIEGVRGYLENSYLEHHSLESLAAMAHLERTYFSRMFSAHTGLPVTEYIARLRIRYAITQLQSNDRPIAEVAAASGFRDLSQFGRTFRRYTGSNPRDYRRNSRS